MTKFIYLLIVMNEKAATVVPYILECCLVAEYPFDSSQT